MPSHRPFREVEAIRIALNVPIGEFCIYAEVHPSTYWEWKRMGRVKEKTYQRLLRLQSTVKRRAGPPPTPPRSYRSRMNEASAAEEILTSDLDLGDLP
jgi:hypothetical protein